MVSKAVKLNGHIWESLGPDGLKQLQDNEVHLAWNTLIKEGVLVIQTITYLSQTLEKGIIYVYIFSLYIFILYTFINVVLQQA